MRFHIGKRGGCVAREILRGCGRKVSRAPAHAAVVVTQHGIAGFRQVIRKHEKWFVARNFFILVLWT